MSFSICRDSEIIQAGYSASDLQRAGFDIDSLRASGLDEATIRSVGLQAEVDRNSLKKFYYATNGRNWTRQNGWAEYTEGCHLVSSVHVCNDKVFGIEV